MFAVVCPTCLKNRFVKAKKPWMKGIGPYECLCKMCCQIGKEKTQEHKDKLSESAKNAQTKRIRKNKSNFMKQHPELWQKNLHPELGPLARIGTHHTEETKQKISESTKGILKTEETKQKISESMINRNKK